MCWLAVNTPSPEVTTTAPGVSVSKRKQGTFKFWGGDVHPGVNVSVSVSLCV